MSSIKVNHTTKEIELKGGESFIESNFNRIQDLLGKSLKEKKGGTSVKPKENREPLTSAKVNRSQPSAEIGNQELSEVSQASRVTQSSVPAISHVIKTNRPPLRKYIRKKGMPGQQRIVVEVAEQKPKEISIEALKENFGLSESKIEGIIRDAEKLGKIKRAVNGSYEWAQD